MLAVAGGAQGQVPFADARLPVAPIAGEIAASGLRAWAWQEDGSSRLVLERDVVLHIAGYQLTADKAALWIAPMPRGEDPRLVQVFAYLEGVDTPDADSAVAVTADDLRIQGVVSLVAPIDIAADAIEPSAPLPGRVGLFTRRAEGALAGFLSEIAPAPPSLDRVPRPVPDPLLPSQPAEPLVPTAEGPRPIIEPDGFVTLAAESVVRTEVEGQTAIVLTGGVTASYSIPGQRRVLELAAQRAVVFLREGSGGQAGPSVRAGEIDGLYLEGDVVAADGGYVLRGPRVFYDLTRDQALVLDAVFSTYDQSRGFPLYVRAESVRQVSQTEFVADTARISNTAFARPSLSLGARSVTITREEPAESTRTVGSEPRPATVLDAHHITLNAGTIPVAYLPRFQGDPERIPLRDLRFVSSTDSGEEIRTRWDLFSLLGRQSPEGFGVSLLADALLDRGPAGGLTATWARGRHRGGLLTYWVLNDTGTDVLSTGARVDRTGETRGLLRAENVTTIDQNWTLFTEVAHVSDPNFIDAFFEDIAESGRLFQNRARLRRLDENTAFWIEVAGQTVDFTPNEYLLQSDGYSVERYPEAGYTRLADDLLPTSPGLLTYSSESRIGFLRLQLTDATPAEYGLTSTARAQRALGLNPNDNIADALRAQGYSENPRFRFDTRHEVVAKLDAGPVQLTPFAVGRITAYDDEFDDFGPGTGNATRLWGSVGMTAATTIQRVYNGVYSRVLDIDRLRHLIRPSTTIVHAESGVEQNELPVYDEEVESLATGTIYRVGLEQTLQTKRGGPGREYSVDLLTLDTEFVFTGEDTDAESSIGRYDPTRPELSRLTDFATVTGTWQATDAVAFTGGAIYDLREGRQSVTTGGIVLQNGPWLTTNLRYRHLNDQDSTLLSAGAEYMLSDKYTIGSNVTFDTDLGQFEVLRLELLRDFQSAVFGTNISYNNTSETTSFGVIFQPLGRGTATRVGLAGDQGGGESRNDSPLGG